jgi:hypothetical protein
MIIKVKIDCKKIDKTKLFHGEKGVYLDCTLLENRDGTDQYGNNFMVVQDVSKADRESGIKGAILGNGKILESKETKRPPAQNTEAQAKHGAPDDIDF